MMTKQAFIDRKLAIQRIDIPAWDDCVYVQKLSAKQRAQIMRSNFKIEGKELELNTETFADNVVRTCQLAICDDQGNRIFDDSKEDFELLSSKDGEVLQTIFDVVMQTNGLTVEEEKDALKN